MKNGGVRATRKRAETLAIQALSYLAADPEKLGRFLAATGIGPGDIRIAAREPLFLAGVLDHIASDEKLLVAFAADAGTDPREIARMQALLGGRDWEREAP